MLFTLGSIVLLGAVLCGQLNVGYGDALGNLGAAAAGAQALNGGGPLGGAVNAVPKCEAPVDHSCDDMSFNDIAGKIAGGGLMSGAQKGILGGAAGGLMGGRRRRGLFGKGVPALPNAPAANPLPAAPPAPGGSPLGNAGGLSSLNNLQGTSFIKDPNGLGPLAVQNKLKKCDEQNKPGGQFDDLKSKLASGDFSSLTDPKGINPADQCKKFMDTEKQQCQMLKRQCCAFLNGQVKDPSKLSCAFKDIMATAGQVQAKNSACETTQKLLENPNDAGNTLQNGAKGVGTGLVLNQGANQVLG